MTRARMSKDGSVIIPKSMRDANGLTAGVELESSMVDGRSG
jgi:hypothetical protein